MRKRLELSSPTSCLNRAVDDEMTFVLLGRDAAAPFAIRAWVAERVRLGKNRVADEQIKEALECANAMELEQAHPPMGWWCSNCQSFQNPRFLDLQKRTHTYCGHPVSLMPVVPMADKGRTA
jgi:hypothetical protein